MQEKSTALFFTEQKNVKCSSTVSSTDRSLYCSHLKSFYKLLTGQPCELSFIFEYSTGDWIFKPQSQQVIKFNTALLNSCSKEYYILVIIHELFHLVKHKILYKSEVKILKDFYGNSFMRIMDIEADLYAAMYFQKIQKMAYNSFLELLYSGRLVFTDAKIRAGKLARFLGSMLSVTHLFKTREMIVFLPELRDVAINGIVYLITTNGSNHQLVNLKMNNHQFEKLKQLYTVPNISKNTYIREINDIINYCLSEYMTASSG